MRNFILQFLTVQLNVQVPLLRGTSIEEYNVLTSLNKDEKMCSIQKYIIGKKKKIFSQKVYSIEFVKLSLKI